MSIFEELPPPRAATPVERAVSRITIVAVMNGFALLYHFLHKFLIPLVIQLTTSLPTSEVVDWWWLYHVVLAVFFVTRKTATTAFFVTIFAGYGGLVVQCAQSFVRYSWHSASLWMTAIATLAVLLGSNRLLVALSQTKRWVYGGIGVALGLLIAAGIAAFLPFSLAP